MGRSIGRSLFVEIVSVLRVNEKITCYLCFYQAGLLVSRYWLMFGCFVTLVEACTASGIVARLVLSEPCDVVEATHEDFFVNFRRPLIFFNVFVITFYIIYDKNVVISILVFEYFFWSLYCTYVAVVNY